MWNIQTKRKLLIYFTCKIKLTTLILLNSVYMSYNMWKHNNVFFIMKLKTPKNHTLCYILQLEKITKAQTHKGKYFKLDCSEKDTDCCMSERQNENAELQNTIVASCIFLLFSFIFQTNLYLPLRRSQWEKPKPFLWGFG